MIPTGTSITGGIMTRTGFTGGGSSRPTVVTWTSTDEALKISVRSGVGVTIRYFEQCGAWEAPVGGLTPVRHQAGPPPTPAVAPSRQPEPERIRWVSTSREQAASCQQVDGWIGAATLVQD